MPLQTLFDFRLATRLLHGPRSVRCLPEFLPPDRRVLVVTDPGLRAAGIVDRVLADPANQPVRLLMQQEAVP